MNGGSSLLKMGEDGENESFDESTREGHDEDVVEGGEEDVSDQDYKFCVGDIVWGKIKNHPWWPGQVYDPLDASDLALKLEKQDDRLLVAYFGDGTFAWCHPSQLKPFEDSFEEMWKSSNLKSFVKAVEKAVDEMGRRMELMVMTCSCVPKENLSGLESPLAANAGIRDGVRFPEGENQKIFGSLFESEALLDEVKTIAGLPCVSDLLAFEVLKRQISAFYRAKGGYQLPVYQDPEPVLGLEDNTKSEDSSSEEKEDSFDISSLGKGVSEERLPHKRKRKSIAKILRTDVNLEATAITSENSLSGLRGRRGRDKKVNLDGGSTSISTLKKRNDEEGTNGDSHNKPIPTSRRSNRRNKANDDGGDALISTLKKNDKNDSDDKSLATLKKKRSKISAPGRVEESKIVSSEHNGSSVEEQIKIDPLTWKRKNKNTSKEDEKGNNSDDAGVSKSGSKSEQSDKEDSSRKRKISKYLLPPYTNFFPIKKKNEDGAELERASELGGTQEVTDSSPPQTPTVMDPLKVSTAAEAVLSGIRSVALDVLHKKETSSSEKVGDFVHMFRSSIYLNGSNYKTYHEQQPTENKTEGAKESEESKLTKLRGKKPIELNGKASAIDPLVTPTSKRNKKHKSQPSTLAEEGEKMAKEKKSLVSEPKLSHKDQNQSRKTKESGETKSRKRKFEQGANGLDTKAKDVDAEAGAEVEAGAGAGAGAGATPTLGLSKLKRKARSQLSPKASKSASTKPESSSKDKNPTSVIEKSEETFKQALNGADGTRSSKRKETSNLEHSPQTTKASGLELSQGNQNQTSRMIDEQTEGKTSAAVVKENSDSKASSGPKKRAKRAKKQSALNSTEGEQTHLDDIKQKLKSMTSMVEMSDGRMTPELKSKLEGEIKDVLEKVSTMDLLSS